MSEKLLEICECGHPASEHDWEPAGSQCRECGCGKLRIKPPPDALEGALLTDDEQAQILETYRDWSDYAKAEAVAQAQLAKATSIIEQRVLDAVRAELLDDYLPRSSESADAFIANAKKRLAGDKG